MPVHEAPGGQDRGNVNMGPRDFPLLPARAPMVGRNGTVRGEDAPPLKTAGFDATPCSRRWATPPGRPRTLAQ